MQEAWWQTYHLSIMGKMALLRAADKRAFNYVEELYEPSHLPEIVLNKLKTEYRRYLVCGGMPEAVEQVL